MCLALFALASAHLFEFTRLFSTQRGAGFGAFQHGLALICVTLGFLVRLGILALDTGEWEREVDSEHDTDSERETGRGRFARESGVLAIGLGLGWVIALGKLMREFEATAPFCTSDRSCSSVT